MWREHWVLLWFASSPGRSRRAPEGCPILDGNAVDAQPATEQGQEGEADVDSAEVGEVGAGEAGRVGDRDLINRDSGMQRPAQPDAALD